MLLVNVQDLTGATPSFKMDVNVIQHPQKLPTNTLLSSGKEVQSFGKAELPGLSITGISPAC